jgi:Tol biopolymer transport system component/DNA-binding winged helix-turn-helix (wHTH) protein
MNKSAKSFYEFGPFRLDLANRLLFRGAEQVPLKKKAVDLLLLLVEHQGQVLTKDELMQELWPDTFVEESNLSQHIYLIRRALGEGPDNPEYIATIPGRGYRFVADVTKIEDETEAVIVETHTVSRIVAQEEMSSAGYLSDGDLARPLSSAEYLIGLAKRHKRGVAVACVALCALAGTLGLGLWYWFGLKRDPPAGEVARIAAFTSFPGREDTAAFSPDGNQIAFAWDGGEGGNLDIYVKQLEVGTPLRLTTDPAEERHPAWSPDGRFIAFSRYYKSKFGIFLIPALGGVERKLGESEAGNGVLSWSPDGKSLACAAKPSSQGQSSIYLLEVSTGEMRRLSAPEQSFTDSQPAFSPDGRWLAFIRSLNSTVSDLYLLSLDGGEPQPLTADKRGFWGVTWSAHGNEIIFSSNRGGPYGLWRVRASGGTPERVAGPGPETHYPATSRQGRRLAYTEAFSDSNIYRFEVPGPVGRGPQGNRGAPARLIASTRADHSPQYSPDGHRLVFVSLRSGANEVWVCDSDGSRPAQLTFIGSPQLGTPRWSPDGRQIAFDASPAGNSDIFTISSEGGQPRRLTTDPAQDILPSWSRDGRWLYFCSKRSGSYQIWKQPLAGGEPVQVTKNGGFEGFESPDGQFLYFTKGRRPGEVWRMPAGGGDEILIPELGNAGYSRYWAMAQAGIFFVPHDENAPPAIKFFNFATRQVTHIASPEKGPFWGPPGLAVSPDGRWILYTQLDQSGSDIMLVENFR